MFMWTMFLAFFVKAGHLYLAPFLKITGICLSESLVFVCIPNTFYDMLRFLMVIFPECGDSKREKFELSDWLF